MWNVELRSKNLTKICRQQSDRRKCYCDLDFSAPPFQTLKLSEVYKLKVSQLVMSKQDCESIWMDKADVLPGFHFSEPKIS